MVPARFHCGLQVLGADVVDEGLGGVEFLGPELVGVVADHVIADDHAPHRQRESDVTLSHNDHPDAIKSSRSSWHACIVAQGLHGAAPPWGGFPVADPVAEASSVRARLIICRNRTTEVSVEQVTKLEATCRSQ